MNQFLCGETTETKEVAPLTWAMETIDYRLRGMAQQIEQQLAEIQEHAQRLPSEFGFGVITGREAHSTGYQAQRSLESLGDKVRRVAMLNEQHLALVLLRRDLAYSLNS
jgi:hypothetical protein